MVSIKPRRKILDAPNADLLDAGSNPDYPTYVAIKVQFPPALCGGGLLTLVVIQGTVFEVTGNKAYGQGGSYKGPSSLCL